MGKRISLYSMAVFYLFGGAMHFANTPFYLQMMPPYLPWHRALIYVSGVAEMAIGGGLLVPRLSRAAAWGAIALLIAVYPANVYMWTDHVAINGRAVPGWFHAVRLPMQAVFLAWAWWHTRAPKPLRQNVAA
jgi:uncharacterized membrane protein